MLPKTLSIMDKELSLTLEQPYHMLPQQLLSKNFFFNLLYLYYNSAVRGSLNNFCALKKENCGGNRRKGFCWLYNPETHPDVQDFFNTFGSFDFQFGEGGQASYEWKAQDYLYQEIAGSRWFCLGLEVFE